MSYYTSTTILTKTSTYTDVKHIIWKIKSDLYQVRLYYKKFDEDYENKLATDLFYWAYSKYCSAFKFTFFDPITQKCAFELKYDVNVGTGAVSADDDAGSIKYYPLSDKTFKVVLDTTASWDLLSDASQQIFYRRLNLSWGPSTFNLSYSHGTWINDKTYSSNQATASRSIFVGI